MINPNTLPEGYTVEETRFLWALCKDGVKVSFAATEEAARFTVNFQPEFYQGLTTERNLENFVDL